MERARLAARLYDVPLLLTPAKADVFDRVFRGFGEEGEFVRTKERGSALREHSAMHLGELSLASGGVARMTQHGYYLTGEGIAIVPVVGTLVQRTGGLDAESGLVSYERLGAMLHAAQGDPSVRGIVFDIDSPGGEAAGVSELASAIRASTKPVTAVANEAAFSAAYWLASAADTLLVPKSGMVGSVGVILMHVDQSVRDQRLGLKYTPITAGDKKADFSPHEPLSDGARADAQRIVDRLYEQFVASVAEHRGIDAQVVRDTEAGVLNADAAVELGMADRVGTLGEAVAQMREDIRSSVRREPWRERAESLSQETLNMDAKLAAEMADKIAAARAEAKAEAQKEFEAKAKSDAVATTEAAAKAAADAIAADRARAAAIVGHDEAKGREQLAQHLAYQSTMDVDAAVAVLKASAKAVAGNQLKGAMSGVRNPDVGADADGAGKPAITVDSSAIYGRMDEASRTGATRWQ